VYFNGAPLSTTVVSLTQITATGSAASPMTSVPLSVGTSDGEWSNAYYVNVTAPPTGVTVSVSPTAASVPTRQTLQFTATVQGSSNTAVVWSVNGINGGNAETGSITSSGLFQAPSGVPRPKQVTIRATSVADPAKSASAQVTIIKR
jgi:hypothetical protein